MSQSLAASTVASSTTTGPNLVFLVSPIHCLSKRLSFCVGKFLSSKHLTISEPTTPKAPITPTLVTLVREPDTPASPLGLASRDKAQGLATGSFAMRNIFGKECKLSVL